MSTWADQHVVATLLLLLPVATALLGSALVVRIALVVPALQTRPRLLTQQRRRHWQVLDVPLRRPDLPGRPRSRAPGRLPACA
ncbi:hypothetical protein FB554_2575 [Barrientosiimonas humi]|uniref:Uncharacterized protein n=1 Tax=Barrientosiimonas humi TaxID=999931 RepID=A0A542XF13_9MICO|nr:hypothetical protein [Barrientosiimonas humi]TQL34405.1 hypothetical protein FB554_2575 [Barrientosiimonas humi]CAG7574395.1 hypothetical protein BH39T_PBIAJDOK_03045 [Barrientosiimonas humi]